MQGLADGWPERQIVRFTKLFVLSMMWLSLPALAQAGVDAVDLVNPLVGTAAEGQTFPSVGVPFAMTQWTPATRTGETKCIAPYYSGDTRIEGFRGSHFLSGSCVKDYGSFQVMAGSGEPGVRVPSSSFAHTDEAARPYEYIVELPENGVRASITGTARAGLMRFEFHRGGRSWVMVENNALVGDGALTVDAARQEVNGRNAVRRLYAGGGQLAGFSGYFVIEFDHPFRSSAVHRASPVPEKQAASMPPEYVTFDLRAGEVVEARIGTSFTSIDEARKNLRAEIPGWSFAEVAGRARAAWQQQLAAVDVQGEAGSRRVFYTALYHSLLVPRILSDVAGTYPSFAGGQRVETAKGFTYYCDFSAWDTFRALHPLLTILAPERDGEMIQSLIAKGQQGGFLPIFPAWNSYTSEMVGDHTPAIIADAYLKGIRGFDAEEAYRLMRKNAMESPASEAAYKDGQGRRALVSYLRYGYVPLEDPVAEAFHKKEQVSRTLEYAYDDFVVGAMAGALGKREDAALFARRAQNYRNVIDPQTGFARGRHADGSWDAPFDPSVRYSYITEGNPFQYTFFVPQDIPGLIQLEHGPAGFVAKLDELFGRGLYDHGNEPSHHIAYLYDYAGAAAKTQEHVHQLMVSKYADRVDGLAGNDDAGQTSAWFVLSALGFYQVTPGTPAYAIGTPLFREATLHLANGHAFHIVAHGVSPRAFYIRSATLNGVPLRRFWLKHAELMAGGELVFEMTDKPAAQWPSDLTVP